ncbi:hypothetical protein GCM10011329_19980 [Stakelama pacifica]|nr:hypothetical protein GCM10011329_19980 [Stakelama pacifica]
MTLTISAHPHLVMWRVNRAMADGLAGIEHSDLSAWYPDGKIDNKAEKDALLVVDSLALQFTCQCRSDPALLKDCASYPAARSTYRNGADRQVQGTASLIARRD